jgi:carboxymethylenebutenolidase
MKRYLPAVALMLSSLVAFAADAPTTGPASLPPPEAQSKERLEKSTRHGEWVELKVDGYSKPVRNWIVYPERPDKAPVVIVIMEIFGMSDWVRATTDQLAADGFIAIAPDFLAGKGPNGGGSESMAPDQVRGAIGQVTDANVVAAVNAAREYGIKLPAANGKSATIGFCWGGGKSFMYAANQPDLNAAVVFYGTPPNDDLMAKVKAPVAGFYGGNDARITATVGPTTDKMKKLEKTYEPHIYEGAGHGFMRQQTSGPNLKAATSAWPDVVKFLKGNTQ